VAAVITEQLLPELDREFLEEKEYTFDVTQTGGEIHLIIQNFELTAAYSPSRADLLVILPAGYPNSNPDMFWTYPDVKLASGAWPQQCQHHQVYGDRNWQRWSRHFQQPWRSGVDCFRTYLAAVRRELAKGI
jgi:hypothetical protein